MRYNYTVKKPTYTERSKTLNFSDKLLLYRKRAKLSQAELSKLLGVSRQSIFKWENSHSYPMLEKIPLLCRTLNVNVSDLISNNEFNEASVYAQVSEITEEIIGSNIRRLRSERGLSQDQFGEMIGVTRQTVSRWETGVISPEFLNIISIAECFSVSSIEVLCKANEEPFPPVTEPPVTAPKATEAQKAPKKLSRRTVIALISATSFAILLVTFSLLSAFLDIPFSIINGIGNIGCEHEPVTDPFIAPTCTSEGMTEGIHCKICGEILLEQTVLGKLSHAPVKQIIPSTCSTEGYSVDVCACGYESEKYEIVKKNHSHSYVTVPFTYNDEHGVDVTKNVDKCEKCNQYFTAHGRVRQKEGNGTFTDTDIEYFVLGNPYTNDIKKLTVYGSGKIPDYVDYAPPWREYLGSVSLIVIEEGITAVGKHAFHNYSTVSKIKGINVCVANTVAGLGLNAFAGLDIQNLFLGSDLQTVGSTVTDHAVNIYIPKSVTKIYTVFSARHIYFEGTYEQFQSIPVLFKNEWVTMKYMLENKLSGIPVYYKYDYSKLHHQMKNS